MKYICTQEKSKLKHIATYSTSRQYKMICIHPMCPCMIEDKQYFTGIPTQRLTTCRMTFNTDSWTETLTWDSSHLQKIDNPKHQTHLLCRPQSMSSCTCAQEGRQHQCDHGMLLPSQVSPPCRKHSKRQDREWKWREMQGRQITHAHLISTQCMDSYSAEWLEQTEFTYM